VQGELNEAQFGREDAALEAALEPGQLVRASRQPFGLRHLTPGERAVMWGLRIYAVLMLLVVIYHALGAILGS